MGAGYFLALDLESVPKSFLFLFFTASICVVWFVVWFFFFFPVTDTCHWQLWKPLYVAAGFCGQLETAKGLADRQAAVLPLLFGLLGLGTHVCFALTYD